MIKVSTKICGTNTRNAPIPPNKASEVKSATTWLPIMGTTNPASAPSSDSTASMAGADQVKILWNNRYIMKKKDTPPVTECRKKLSRRVCDLSRMSPFGPNRRANW